MSGQSFDSCLEIDESSKSLVLPHVADLAAQCEIPPPLSRNTLSDSIAEGGIAPICLVFIGYRASIAEIPLLGGGGYRTPTSHALQGGKAQKKGRGYRTQLPMFRHQKPHSAQSGGKMFYERAPFSQDLFHGPILMRSALIDEGHPAVFSGFCQRGHACKLSL